MLDRAVRFTHGALLGAAMIAAATAQPSTAHAAQCASFSADSGNNTIVLGEATNYFWHNGNKVYFGLGYLSICWLNSLGSQVYDTFSGQCDTSSSSSDWVYVQALAGNDVIFPNARTDTDCTVGNRMWPFDESIFDFYLTADGGTGVDEIFGTENGDLLRSNIAGTFPNLTPADTAADNICGYGGNDQLFGDQDDTDSFEEILVGGENQDGSVDSDTCNGGYDGNTFDWLHTSCENQSYGWSTGTDMVPCNAAPPDRWWK